MTNGKFQTFSRQKYIKNQKSRYFPKQKGISRHFFLLYQPYQNMII